MRTVLYFQGEEFELETIHEGKYNHLSPITVSELSGRGPFDGPYLGMKELVDKDFVILEARKTPGKFGEQEHFYHCQCVDPETDEPFHSSLSGVVVNEVIAQWLEEARDRPLRVKLLEAHNASGMGYYDLE